MIVIVLALVLLMLLFPRLFIERTVNPEAIVMAYSIENGISAFQAEYRRMPIPASISANGEYVDLKTNKEFMDIMLGFDEDMNPRKHSFISVKPAKISDGLARGGIHNGVLYDSWGAQYGIRLSLNGEKQVPNLFLIPPSLDNPKWGSGTNPKITDKEILNTDVIVWSSGENVKKAGDNPITIK